MKDYSADIQKLERRLKPLENIRGGVGIRVSKTPGGLVIDARNVGAPKNASAAAESTSGGVTLELYPEWDGDRQYRLDERVVYKAVGETYYQIYECNDVSAGAGDVPGVSAKWTARTTTADEWESGTTYAAAAEVMWGTPWQYYIYTSTENGNVGNEPGKSDKWTKGAGVVWGIKQWPPASGVFVPFKEHVLADTRYDTTTYKFELLFAAHTFDKGGNLTAVALGDYTVWAEAEACA